MSRIMHILLYLFSLFPFVKFFFVDFGSDQQPYALIISILIVLLYILRGGKWPRATVVIVLVCMVATFWGAIDGINTVYARSMANYLSLFFITFAVYVDLLTYKRIDERFIKLVILTWTSVGVIQRFVNRGFLTALLSASRTSLDRGVVSLAVEPTTYGLFCLLMIVICWEYFESGRVLYTLLCVFQLIFLAQSSMALLLLGILLFYVGIVYFLFSYRLSVKLKVLAVVVVGFFAAYFFVDEFLAGARIQRLMTMLIKNPLSIVMLDASVNDRVSHVYFSIRGALDNYLIPNGFNAWRQYVTTKSASQTTFFWVSKGDRIMSGYGAVLFELGVFGLILLVTTTRIIMRCKMEFRRRIIYTLFIQAVMFTAIPIGFPLYPFLIGTFLYYGRRDSAPQLE